LPKHKKGNRIIGDMQMTHGKKNQSALRQAINLLSRLPEREIQTVVAFMAQHTHPSSQYTEDTESDKAFERKKQLRIVSQEIDKMWEGASPRKTPTQAEIDANCF